VSDVRHEVALGCRALQAEGHADMVWGHVSVRDHAGRGVWMKASGWGFDEVTAEEVILIDRHGEIVEGHGRCHIEYPIHTEILAVRPDVGSVVHTHAPHALAFAATGDPLRPISHDATLFVPPDIVRYTRTADLILTAELGADLAAALGERNALLIPGHGIVTVGSDIGVAVMSAVLLERACRLQLLAMAAGGVRIWSDDDEALAKRNRCWSPAQLRAGWEYLARRAAR
jgi:L-ribulose-5-phosphate 4-epimerase